MIGLDNDKLTMEYNKEVLRRVRGDVLDFSK